MNLFNLFKKKEEKRTVTTVYLRRNAIGQFIKKDFYGYSDLSKDAAKQSKSRKVVYL